MKFYIEIAQLTDSKPITRLSNQLGYPTRSDFISNRLTAILSKPDHIVFVAKIENHVVGWIHAFVAYRVESDDFVEIGGLVVDESKQNKGIGSALVDQVHHWSKELNVMRVRVRCNVIREKAHAFYIKNGFSLNKKQMIFTHHKQEV